MGRFWTFYDFINLGRQACLWYTSLTIKEMHMGNRKKIDLNSDVGESFGHYKLGMDDAVIPLISSANIACGFHAGDPAVMRNTMVLAKKHGVAPGAHPGFPDLLGFGRRNLEASLEEIKDYIAYQIGALQAFAAMEGLSLQHVKPHGALYNMAVKNTAIWEAVAEVISRMDPRLILVVLAGANRQELLSIGGRHGIRIAFEFFGDRAYNPDGSLVSRKEPGSVIHDQDLAASRILKLVKKGKVEAKDGTEIELVADTICVHGDNPTAVALTMKIRENLLASGVEIAPLGSFL
jgi:5-oxoprolinase (ATP-hydrolysing) subunit A